MDAFFFSFPTNKPGTTSSPGLRDGAQQNTSSSEQLLCKIRVALSLREDCLSSALF